MSIVRCCRLSAVALLWLFWCTTISAIQLQTENPMLDLNDKMVDLVLRGSTNEVVCSPVLYQVLTGAYRAANDKTQRQIQTVLGTENLARTSKALANMVKEQDELTNFFRVYHKKAIVTECATAQLRSINKRERCKRIMNLLKAYGEGLNLSAPQALEHINSDVAQATDGQIENLFSHLDPEARMVMVAALTFSAEWLTDLAPMSTGMNFFSGDARLPGRVPAVQIAAPLRFMPDDGDGVTGVGVPYNDRGLQFEMFFFMAEPLAANITSLVRRRHYERLADVSPLDTQVTLTFPQFSLVSKKHDYLDVLRQLGLGALLDGGLGPNGDDKIDQLVHKAVIDVDERGTRAAGAAGASIIPRVGASESAKSVVVTVDRPFLASVVHVTQLMPLFTAHVTEPLLD